jgi:hypothetical protein
MKTVIAQIGVLVLLIGSLSAPATPQGGCTFKPWAWNLSGASSLDPNNPTNASWLAGIAYYDGIYGGAPPNCTYTWVTASGGTN